MLLVRVGRGVQAGGGGRQDGGSGRGGGSVARGRARGSEPAGRDERAAGREAAAGLDDAGRGVREMRTASAKRGKRASGLRRVRGRGRQAADAKGGPCGG